LPLQQHIVPLSRLHRRSTVAPILEHGTPGSSTSQDIVQAIRSSNVTINSDKNPYFSVPATLETFNGSQETFNLLLDITYCSSFVRNVQCNSPADSYSCNGPKWDNRGLTADLFGSTYGYQRPGITVETDNFFTNVNIGGFTGGFTARHMSFGASQNTYNWQPYLGDGVLGVCNPIYYLTKYPYLIDTEWFPTVGLTGDVNMFSIFLPKEGAGNIVDAKSNKANGYWGFIPTDIQYSIGSKSFKLAPPKIVYFKLIENGLWVHTQAYQTIFSTLGVAYDSTIGFFTVSCSLRHSGPPIKITFDNTTTITIPPDAYIEHYADDATKCIPLVNDAGVGPGNQVVFGVPFIKQHYTIFDFTNIRLGIATSVQKYV
ncbi:hypothetical protein HDU76_004874, partial [Blyttiomyces sp. JEL0837]